MAWGPGGHSPGTDPGGVQGGLGSNSTRGDPQSSDYGGFSVSQGDVSHAGGTVSSAAETAAANREKALKKAQEQQAISNLHSQSIATGGLPPSASSYSKSQVNAEVNSMQDRRSELGTMKDKSNEDLNELGELNSLFGLNPTEDMGLAESVRYNVTNEDFKSDLSQLANNPLFSFASAAMGNPLGIVSLIGKGIGNIYGAVTNPVDTVTSAAQSVGDWFGGLDVQPTPPESPGGGRPDPVSPLYYQTLGEETIPEEDMTGVMDYAPVYYGVDNWPGAISYAKNGGLASLVPKRRRI